MLSVCSPSVCQRHLGNLQPGQLLRQWSCSEPLLLFHLDGHKFTVPKVASTGSLLVCHWQQSWQNSVLLVAGNRIATDTSPPTTGYNANRWRRRQTWHTHHHHQLASLQSTAFTIRHDHWTKTSAVESLETALLWLPTFRAGEGERELPREKLWQTRLQWD